MNIEILVDGSRLRTWHTELGMRLGAGPEARVGLRVADGPPLPSAVELLLSLEQLVHRRPTGRMAARAQVNGAERLDSEDVDVTIDLHAGDAAAVIRTNDLSIAYVHENSAYST